MNSPSQLLRLPFAILFAATCGCSGSQTGMSEMASSPSSNTAMPDPEKPTIDIVLPPPTATELAALTTGRKDRPHLVGIGRSIPAEQGHIVLKQLQWHKTESGQLAASVAVKSTGARSVRLGLRLTDEVPGLTLSFARSAAKVPASALVGDAPQWSPVTQGDTVTVKLNIAEPPNGDAALELLSVSHLP